MKQVNIALAFGFANWISENKYVLCADGSWMDNGTGTYVIVAASTDELFDKFVVQKNEPFMYSGKKPYRNILPEFQFTPPAPTSRDPEVIEAELKKLEKELAQARLERRLTPLWIDNEHSLDDDDIGFFRIGKAEKLLTALNDNKVLLIKHDALGNYMVHMNGGGNRILVYNEDGTDLEYEWLSRKDGSSETKSKSRINEDTIMGFIVWHAGDWYVMNDLSADSK